MFRRLLFTTFAVSGAVMLGTAPPASAATTVSPVSEAQLQDGRPSSPSDTDPHWYRQDTTTGGGVTLTKDFGAPPPPQELGDGALALTTNAQNSAQAQLVTYHHVYGTPLTDVADISYWTYHSSQTTGFADGNAAIDLRVDIDGDLSTTDDRTTLVYETYWNDTEGTDPQHPEGTVPDTWQFWDAIAGGWWSTKTFACGDFVVEGTAGGPPNTRPGDVANGCPDAKVVSLAVTAGDFNPNYVVAVDGIHFETSTNAYFWDFGPK